MRKAPMMALREAKRSALTFRYNMGILNESKALLEKDKELAEEFLKEEDLTHSKLNSFLEAQGYNNLRQFTIPFENQFITFESMKDEPFNQYTVDGLHIRLNGDRVESVKFLYPIRDFVVRKVLQSINKELRLIEEVEEIVKESMVDTDVEEK